MKNMMISQTLLASIVFLWAGMIVGISGLEAWVKFKTTSLTRIIGLDVGLTVFRAFHRVQWVVFLLLTLAVILVSPSTYHFILIFSLGLILIVQVYGLMPRLSYRIMELKKNKKINSSPGLHTFYAILELSKFLLLCRFGLENHYSYIPK